MWRNLFVSLILLHLLFSYISYAKEKNCYEKLGLDQKAKTDEITRKFRKLALKYHPDKVSEDKKAESEEKFKELASCYEILRDEESRKKYDASGYNLNFEAEPGVKHDSNFNFGSFEDIFASFFGNTNSNKKGKSSFSFSGSGNSGSSSSSNGGFDFFSEGVPPRGNQQQFYRQQQQQQHQHQHQHPNQQGSFEQGNSQRYSNQQQQQQIQKIKLEVTLEELMKDSDVLATLDKKRSTTIKVPVPKGSPDHHIINYKGYEFEIHTKKHSLFERGLLSHKSDLYLTMPITLTQAITGFSFDVPCLDGTIQHINIKPNEISVLKTHYEYQIKKKGLPRFQGNTFGHLYIKFDIQLPKNLHDDQINDFVQLSSKWKYPLTHAKYKQFHITSNYDNNSNQQNDEL